MEMFEQLKNNIKDKGIKIVFPEANDKRIIEAASKLSQENLLTPILLGKEIDVKNLADSIQVNIDQCQIIDVNQFSDMSKFVNKFVERRMGKVTEEQAQDLLQDPNYFGTMMVYLGYADGMVSGAIHSTGDTVRPAIQIIKTKEGVSRVSGAFVMVRDNEKYIFADCAINLNPSAQELAEIALESAKTAEMFGLNPKVAMLSFSTKGSGKGEDVQKVAEATKIVQQMNTNINYQFDGELQFDAAFSDTVAKLKAPNSPVAGQANVFIFPDLQSGNIGYKIAQRLGSFDAVGPILQGLNKPVSDLSRGCNADEVYKVSLITASQTLIED